MKELGSLLKRFIEELEYAKYYPSDEMFPSLELRRVRLPPYGSLMISVEFSFRHQFHMYPYMEPHRYSIYSDGLHRKIYWRGQNCINGLYEFIEKIGPFDTYEQAAMNLEVYLVSQYGLITWRDLTEVKLDLLNIREEDE